MKTSTPAAIKAHASTDNASENVLAGWRIGDAGATVFGPKSEHAAPVTIAQLMPPTLRVSAAQRKRIAALIVAAPALLEALQAIVAAAQTGKIVANHHFFTESSLLIKQAEAAIQSATV